MSENTQRYLCIENAGVAPVEAFTLLGASNKAGTDAIGQFGSGAKHGPLVLLRNGIPPIICAGLTKIEYSTTPAVFEGTEHEQVVVRLSGKTGNGSCSKSINRTEKLSVVVNYGSTDWKSPVLACREFVSNALDATNANVDSISLTITDTVRSKAGYTRVFVPLTEEIEEFFKDIKGWFLHFTPNAVWAKDCIIRKPAPSPAKIYRRGVLVRTVNKNSLFDYNLNDIKLDEARVADDYSVRYYASIALERSTTPEVIAELLLAEECWEHSFDLNNAWLVDSEKEKQSATWTAAQTRALGDDTVLATKTQDASIAERKGYKVKRVPENVYNAAVKAGVRTVNKVLTTDEREGRKIDEITNDLAIAAVGVVWAKLQEAGHTRGEIIPKVFSFTSELQSESKVFGFYRDGGVYINNCLLSAGGISRELFATVLEEIAHYVTKATDNSRDFQDYFIQIAVTALSR